MYLLLKHISDTAECNVYYTERLGYGTKEEIEEYVKNNPIRDYNERVKELISNKLKNPEYQRDVYGASIAEAEAYYEVSEERYEIVSVKPISEL